VVVSPVRPPGLIGEGALGLLAAALIGAAVLLPDLIGWLVS
jgi:hypothetical protein